MHGALSPMPLVGRYMVVGLYIYSDEVKAELKAITARSVAASIDVPAPAARQPYQGASPATAFGSKRRRGLPFSSSRSVAGSSRTFRADLGARLRLLSGINAQNEPTPGRRAMGMLCCKYQVGVAATRPFHERCRAHVLAATGSNRLLELHDCPQCRGSDHGCCFASACLSAAYRCALC